MIKQVDLKKPLTPEILSNPNNEFVKTLVYIYSMECFVFGEMNRASRNKDIDKIKFFGPLASALSFIVYCGNMRKSELAKRFTVYRGFKANLAEIQ